MDKPGFLAHVRQRMRDCDMPDDEAEARLAAFMTLVRQCKDR